MPFHSSFSHRMPSHEDCGPRPFAVNLACLTRQNDTYRTALWTGSHLQVTLMSLCPGEDIGLERHEQLDQFLRIEEGQGVILMGDDKNSLHFRATVCSGYACIIPAGKWHNLLNTGSRPLKLYSIYAPVEHPHGTVHRTKAEALQAEHHH